MQEIQVKRARKGKKNRAICQSSYSKHAEKKSACKRNTTTKTIVAKFRNSLFNLKLRKKLSYEFNKEIAAVHQDNIYKVCTNYTKVEKFDDIGNALNLLKFVIGNNNLTIVIDGDNGNLYAVEELSVQQFWHFFPVQKIIQYLEHDNANLLTYLQVMNAFIRNNGFSDWYSDDIYGYALLLEDDYHFQSEFEALIDDDQYEKANELAQIRNFYKVGAPIKYAKILRKQDIVNKSKLIRKVKLINHEKLKAWLLEAIDVSYNGFDVQNYRTMFLGFNDEGLSLNQTYSVVWDDKDMLFRYASECMDDEASNCGYEVAHAVYELTDSNNVNFNDYADRVSFLDKVSDLWKKYNDIYEQFN
jgi:hypothetical protein